MKSNRKIPSPDIENIMPLLIGAWRRMLKIGGPADVLQTREFRDVVANVKILQARSENGQSLTGKDYFKNPQLLGAYLLYDWVLHYQQGLSLIGELPDTPRRVLDMCSGAAPFAFAALRHGAREVIATDQNMAALQLGAEVCGRYGLPLSIRQWNSLKQPMPLEGQFDLIIMGHCLEDLFPSTQKGWMDEQNSYLKEIMNHLTPDGHLLLVDNSLNEANRRILMLRDSMVEAGFPIQAPCVWRGECPALKANSQCYAQRELEKPRLIRDIQRSASINLNSLKMSYLILRSAATGWPNIGQQPLYRVISPPIDTFSGKRFYLCGTDGKKQLGSHIEKYPVESRAFEYLKRGELIFVHGALERQNALDIVQGTTVRVVAACGKPIPNAQQDQEP